MAKEVTKAPTGLKITRTGNKFTASWKIGDKDYGDSQHFQYIINDTGEDSWVPKKKTEIGHKATSKVITTINKADYYPNVDKKGNNKPCLYTIGFRVKGNRKSYTTGSGKKKKTHKPSPSAWAKKEFTVDIPRIPSVVAELDEELTNVCKFTWSAPYYDDDTHIFTDVQWQTILVKNSAETDGSKLNWKNAEEGSGGAESSKTITEDTEILYKNGDSYVRWFRIRSRGPRGYTEWRYAYHVYALSHQANVTGTSASETDEGGFQCVVDWTVAGNRQNPIDKTTAQYTITIPDEGLTCPSGVSWSDANISRDTGEGDAAVFSIDDQLGKDQCLFIRVNTQHDSNITYGKPQLSAVGFLKDPSGLSVSTDNVTHKATIRATNNSDVEDSILVVRYVPSSGDPIDIGVIPHNSSSVTVQCPDWDDQTAIAFDVYAMVGTATKQDREDGVDSYSVDVKMRSQNTITQGGAVPVAPQNVSVNRVEGKPDTVRVDWDWPWSDAGSAEISWSDHDDAWESTDEPESFLISNLHASHWNISGLETGKTWYVRVRLIAGDMTNTEDVTYGPWSDISQGMIDLSSAPNKPVLILSNSVIPEEGSTTASWVYTTTDNTAQSYAEVAIVDNGEYTPIAHSLTAQHVTIPAKSENYSLSTGNIYNLVCRVKSASGKLSEWSDIVSLTVAEPITCEIAQTSLVHDLIETNPREFGPDDSLSFETELEEDYTKLQVNLEPVQDLHGYDNPWVGGAGKNKFAYIIGGTNKGVTAATNEDGSVTLNGTASGAAVFYSDYFTVKAGTYIITSGIPTREIVAAYLDGVSGSASEGARLTFDEDRTLRGVIQVYSGQTASNIVMYPMLRLASETDDTYEPYENICPITGHDKAEVGITGKNLWGGEKLADSIKESMPSAVVDSTDKTVTFLANATVSGEVNLFPIRYEENTRYTLILTGYNASGYTNLRVYYTDGSNANITGSVVLPASKGTVVYITSANKTVSYIRKVQQNGAVTLYYEESGIFKGALTADDFEPYQGQSLSETFEVEYTPTVIDETPYLFKKTGDVCGDRLSQDLVGGTVNWNQLAKFTNNTSNGITLTANTDGSITLQGTATADAVFIFDSQKHPTHVLLYCGCKNGSASTYGIGNSISGVIQTTSDKIYKTSSTGVIYSYVQVKSGTDLTTPVTFTPQFHDLTAMFGNSATADYVYSLEQANAGAGIAWLRKYFPDLFAYSPYNTGTLVSVKPTAHVTRDVNQWDGEWENGDINSATGLPTSHSSYWRTKNYIPIFPNTEYYAYVTGVTTQNGIRARFYDANKQYIGYSPKSGATATNRTFVTPDNAYYLKFAPEISVFGSNKEFCINLSNADINGTYYSADHHTYPISELELRGFPQIVNGELRFDGDIRKPNGQVTRKYRLVDLGTLPWQYLGGLFLTNIRSGGQGLDKVFANMLCPIYTLVDNNDYSNWENMSMRNTNVPENPILRIKNTNYTDAAEFKAAMSGVYLLYELATPTTETAPTFADLQICNIYGTEEFVDERDVSIPAGHVTTYKTRDIFGGTIDLASGVLTVTHAVNVYDGSESWTKDSDLTGGIHRFYLSDDTIKKYSDYTDVLLSNKCKAVNNYQYASNMDEDFAITAYSIFTNNYNWAYIFSKTIDTVNGIKSWLEEEPLQFLYPLATPQTYQLTPQQLETLKGLNKIESEDGQVEIRIAESVWEANVLKEMPLAITVTGAGDGGITTIMVERAEDYPMERPDETSFHGNKGEVVLQTSPPLIGTNQVSFDVKDLIGPMDDGAAYNIVATVQDGLGQTDDAILPFEVHWTHQAEEPSAEIEIDEENLIAFITPIAPENADPEDVADIYRLSADRPELIVEGAEFGETYVDPYPALGDMGGHRIVTRTKNGDYITEDNQIAMIDSPELGVNPIENEDLLNIIDFEGRQIQFYWETDYSNTWAKDFQETQYLGGSIEGDWNPAVSRSGTLSSKAITVLDQEMLKDVRRLADYPGICHVRTADGSSYAADVQVSEDYTDDEKGMVTNYSLSITKVDPQGFEGMTKDQWDEENPPEEEEEP